MLFDSIRVDDNQDFVCSDCIPDRRFRKKISFRPEKNRRTEEYVD
jgi:hypothetical protein